MLWLLTVIIQIELYNKISLLKDKMNNINNKRYELEGINNVFNNLNGKIHEFK